MAIAPDQERSMTSSLCQEALPNATRLCRPKAGSSAGLTSRFLSGAHDEWNILVRFNRKVPGRSGHGVLGGAPRLSGGDGGGGLPGMRAALSAGSEVQDQAVAQEQGEHGEDGIAVVIPGEEPADELRQDQEGEKWRFEATPGFREEGGEDEKRIVVGRELRSEDDQHMAEAARDPRPSHGTDDPDEKDAADRHHGHIQPPVPVVPLGAGALSRPQTGTAAWCLSS